MHENAFICSKQSSNIYMKILDIYKQNRIIDKNFFIFSYCIIIFIDWICFQSKTEFVKFEAKNKMNLFDT